MILKYSASSSFHMRGPSSQAAELTPVPYPDTATQKGGPFLLCRFVSAHPTRQPSQRRVSFTIALKSSIRELTSCIRRVNTVDEVRNTRSKTVASVHGEELLWGWQLQEKDQGWQSNASLGLLPATINTAVRPPKTSHARLSLGLCTDDCEFLCSELIGARDQPRDRSPIVSNSGQAMDDGAFVESLLNPELRTTPRLSPRRSSLLISASFASPSSPSTLLVSPRQRGKAMDTGGSSTRGGVGPEEEEAFRQLLNEHNFEDSLAMPSHLDHIVEQLQGSQLIEPMDLPKLNPISAAYDPAFLHLTASPMALSPTDFSLFTPTGQSPSSSHQDPHRTPRSSFYEDGCPPVQPIGSRSISSGYEANHGTFYHPAWSGPVFESGPHTAYPLGMRPTAEFPSSRLVVSSNGSKPRRQIASLPPPVPVWVPATLLTPTGAVQTAPDLTRNISSKKSKARKPSDSVGKANAVTTKLTASLANTPPKPKRVGPPAADTSQASSSDEAQEKNTKGKKCVEDGCTRRAQSNSRCKAHGGGARCQYAGPGGCTRSSQGGGFCRAHGGGKRCEYPDCTRGQQRKGRCYVHGGIRKCQTDGCEKKDRGNGYCISHGGGKRCVADGCSRSVRRGQWCQFHEDGASAS